MIEQWDNCIASSFIRVIISKRSAFSRAFFVAKLSQEIPPTFP